MVVTGSLKACCIRNAQSQSSEQSSDLFRRTVSTSPERNQYSEMAPERGILPILLVLLFLMTITSLV